MSVIGTIDSLWRYPVKSMAGEELEEAFVGFSGVYGDRLYAIGSSASPRGLPYLTAREQKQMLRYRPRFRHPESAGRPPHLADTEGIQPGPTPLEADPADLVVDVVAPSGNLLAVDDPTLLRMLVEGMDDAHRLTLIRSGRAMTDCRPISLFAVQTAHALASELGGAVDKRCFRANIYLDLGSADGFAEDGFVGRALRIGSRAVISILERDPRCKVITLDPDTAEPNPQILR
ncbi:MAG: MOSC domain-containing protein, partial [Planctomycetota bacterium]